MVPICQTQNLAFLLNFCYFIPRKFNNRTRVFISIKLTRYPAQTPLVSGSFRLSILRPSGAMNARVLILIDPETGIEPGKSCRTFRLPTFVT